MLAAVNATQAVTADGNLLVASVFAPGAQTALQGVAWAILAATTASLTYLIVERRKLERMHGEAWSNLTLLVMIGCSMLILAVFQLVIVSCTPLACAVEALLSAATLPVSATVYLAKAWALIMQFARVSEQTRWFHIYQMTAAERDEIKGLRPPWAVRINAFLARHRAVAAPEILLGAALLFGAATWLPLAWSRYQGGCLRRPDPIGVNVIPGLLALTVALIWWQFKGRDDSAKQKRELTIVAIVLVGIQALRSAGDLVQARAGTAPGDAPPFLFWYDAGLNAAQLALQVVVTMLVPAVRLLRFQGKLLSQSQANNQRLVEILANSRYKEHFRQFLEMQFSQENLIFYDLCRDVSEKARSSLPFMDPEIIFELQDSIHAIYNDFVSDSSKFQVNLPNGIRTQILEAVTALRSVEMFTIETQVRNLQVCVAALDQAAASIFSLLASDALPRFLQHRKETRKERRPTATLRNALSSYSRARRETVFSKGDTKSGGGQIPAILD